MRWSPVRGSGPRIIKEATDGRGFTRIEIAGGERPERQDESGGGFPASRRRSEFRLPAHYFHAGYAFFCVFVLAVLTLADFTLAVFTLATFAGLAL